MLSQDRSGGEPVLQLEHVDVRFGGVRALQDVRFEVLPGEIHCLAGENGSGKSTLIKVITGVHQPAPGKRIRIDGVEFDRMSPARAREAGIAVIWQDLALFPEMTVAENIGVDQVLGGMPRRVPYRRMRETARSILGRLGSSSIDVEARLGSLGISQRQIVAIARALAGDAKILFMDEPTASLTQSETDRLLAIVTGLSAQGVAIVFVSHRLAEVLDVSSRVTVLRDGRLVGVFPTKGMSQSRLTELMTGMTFDQDVLARDRGMNPEVLRTEGLTRRGNYEDVSLVVRKGEIVGVTGLLGAGRTELAMTVFGMLRPDRGRVLLDGAPTDFRSNRDAIRAGVGYLSEDRLSLGLIQQQSTADNLVLPVIDRLTSRGLVSQPRKDEAIDFWIRDLAIKAGDPDNAVSTLSGGNQQRVAIAKWLAVEPKLMILDSPTVGVDVGARAGIFRIVRALAEKGLGILLISDEVPEVYFNSDRVLHMAGGRIAGEYDPRSIALADLEQIIYA